MTFQRSLPFLLSTSMLFSCPALAQEVQPGPSAPSVTQSEVDDIAASGEIIVTAQKRSERLSDVPMSITAVTGDQLATQGITSASDLPKIAPGLTYVTSSFGLPIYSIRGIGFYDNSLGIAPTVSVYQDQIPFAYSAMTAGVALDPERVEILKGPQGTLFGNNSTGGAINFIAAKPTDDFHAGAEITYGRFDQVDIGGYISGPITDTLRARFAFRSENRGDYIRAERPGATGPTRNDTAGQRDFNNARLILDFEPSDGAKFEFVASGWTDKSDTQPAQYQHFRATVPLEQGGYIDPFLTILPRTPAPDNARVADWDEDFDLARNDKFYQLSLRSDIDLSDTWTLTALTAYSHLKMNLPIDNDGTDHLDFRNTTLGKLSSFSQEIRVSGDIGDTIKLVLGGNYAHDVSKDDQVAEFNSSNNGVGPDRFDAIINSNHQKVDTYAVFGSADIKITDQLTLQGSARYTKQNRDFIGCIIDVDGQIAQALSNVTGVVVPDGTCVTIDPSDFSQGPVVDTLDEDNLSWRASLNYKFNPDSLIYANITKGYKAGSFGTLASVFAPQLEPVKQESVLAYEAGFKTSFWDRKISVAGAAFYYDYKDKQLLGYLTIPIFGNIPGLVSVDGRVKGAELEVTARPIDGLRISLSGTYVHARGKGDKLVTDPYAVLSPVDGQRFPRIPDWQVVGDAEYRFPVSSSAEAFLGASLNYQSDQIATFGVPGGENIFFEMPSYALVDLRAGLETDRWRLTVWGKNITNEFYTTDVSRIIDSVSRAVGMPATYGVTAAIKF